LINQLPVGAYFTEMPRNTHRCEWSACIPSGCVSLYAPARACCGSSSQLDLSMMHRTAISAIVIGAACLHNAAAAAAGVMPVVQCDAATLEGCATGLACAREDEHWAQCVNCSAEQFALDCPYFWNANLTAAAEEICGQTCLGQRGSQCVSIGCDASRNLTCVSSSETWSQCVDCEASTFQEDCGWWSEEMIAAAETTCSTICHAHSLIRLL